MGLINCAMNNEDEAPQELLVAAKEDLGIAEDALKRKEEQVTELKEDKERIDQELLQTQTLIKEKEIVLVQVQTETDLCNEYAEWLTSAQYDSQIEIDDQLAVLMKKYNYDSPPALALSLQKVGISRFQSKKEYLENLSKKNEELMQKEVELKEQITSLQQSQTQIITQNELLTKAQQETVKTKMEAAERQRKQIQRQTELESELEEVRAKRNALPKNFALRCVLRKYGKQGKGTPKTKYVLFTHVNGENWVDWSDKPNVNGSRVQVESVSVEERKVLREMTPEEKDRFVCVHTVDGKVVVFLCDSTSQRKELLAQFARFVVVNIPEDMKETAQKEDLQLSDDDEEKESPTTTSPETTEPAKASAPPKETQEGGPDVGYE